MRKNENVVRSVMVMMIVIIGWYLDFTTVSPTGTKKIDGYIE